jgi:nucleoid DNA-binding protein
MREDVKDHFLTLDWPNEGAKVQLAINKTTKIGSFPLPGIEKLSPSSPNSHTNRNPATGAEIKIPAERMVKRRG